MSQIFGKWCQKMSVFLAKKFIHDLLEEKRRENGSNDVAMAINEIVRKLESTGEADVNSEYIGSLVMKALLKLDKVGYIRYASVYKNFENAGDFEDFVNNLRPRSG